MNSKAQLDEINIVAIIGGLICGIIAYIVEMNVNVGFIYKILAFIIGSVIGYFLINRISNN